MAVIAAGLRLVIVLFSLQMHQVKFIDQTQLFQQSNSSVDSRTVDFRILLLSKFKKLGRVEMTCSALDDADQYASLSRDANSSCDEFIHQGGASN